MESKKIRNIKVISQSGHNYKPTPTVILKGQWLNEMGFEIGDQIKVECENGKLVISLDREDTMGKIRVTEENCLAVANLKAAALWHPALNSDMTPFDIRTGSYLKAWWRCNKGHEWKAMVRTLEAGIGFPVCLEIGEFISGKNDLHTVCPEIASEWHPEKNGGTSAGDVSVFSNYNAWWKCHACGHEWRCPVVTRTKYGGVCPKCCGNE